MERDPVHVAAGVLATAIMLANMKLKQEKPMFATTATLV
jgi:hypothetical protein